MVERNKTSERDSVLEKFDMDQNKQSLFFTLVGRIHREVMHGYTNSDGLMNRRSTMVERSAKKTKFEVQRSTPETFLLLEMESADRGVQRIHRRDVSRCNEKRGMAGRSTGQKTMEEKEAKLSSKIGKNTLKHRARTTRKSRICSKTTLQ